MLCGGLLADAVLGVWLLWGANYETTKYLVDHGAKITQNALLKSINFDNYDALKYTLKNLPDSIRPSLNDAKLLYKLARKQGDF